MKPARKRVTVTGMAGEAEAALRELLIDRPLAWLSGARARARNLPKTNFDMGCDFAEQGKWLDAIFRFRVTLFLQPAYPQAQYNLGCCYFRTGRLPQAKLALQKALQQKPGHQDALFMLAAIDPTAVPPGQRPERMPKPMVVNFFTSIAEGYDIAEAQNNYQAGKVIYEWVKPSVRAANPVVIDLACGSGIVARPWRSAAREIVGIDLTRAMITLANKATHADKKLFDQLIEADSAQLPLTLSADQADLVLLVNAAQFIGELSGTMQGVAKLLRPGGVLVITVETHASATGFGLSAETGRFGHSSAYVKQAAGAAGLTFVKEAQLEIYAGLPTETLLFSKGSM